MRGVFKIRFDFDRLSRSDKRAFFKAFFSSVHYFDDVVAVASFDQNSWSQTSHYRLARFDEFFAFVYDLIVFEFECAEKPIDEFDESDEDCVFPRLTEEFKEEYSRRFYSLLNYLEAEVLSNQFEDLKEFPATFFTRDN